MGYGKHKNFITGFDPGNVICDEHQKVSYAELSGMLEELDDFFGKYKKDEIVCLGVFMKNSALQAVVILYLLCEKINFFLYSGNHIATNNVPFFCDAILTGDSND